MADASVVEPDWRQRDWIARAYYRHGLFCASHPRLILCLTAVVLIICSAPLLIVPEVMGSASEWITSSSSRVESENGTSPGWFVGEPLMYIQQFMINVKLHPWDTNLHPEDVLHHSLEPAFHISKYLKDFSYPEEQSVALEDLCLEIPESFGQLESHGWRLDILGSKILPKSGCLIVSPANFWGGNFTSFQKDNNPLSRVMTPYGRPSFSVSVREILFGVPFEKTGLFPKQKENSPSWHVQYSVTLVLNHHDTVFMEKLREKLEKEYPMRWCDESSKPSADDIVHIHYKANTWTVIEMGPLCVMYFIVFLYLAFSLAKMEFVKSKVGLAFSAVMSVIFSLTMAAGSCQFLGLIPTLNSSEIFPYLVIVIGVENMLVITKSVVSTPFHLEVKTRVAEGLSKEGRSITINLLTELGICLSGYFTYVPAVQEFCLFAVTGLLTDFFLQIVFFTTVLSIDIRRMELTDLQRQSVHNQYVRSQSQSNLNTNKAEAAPPSPLTPPKAKDITAFAEAVTSSPQGTYATPPISTSPAVESHATPFLSILLPALPSVPKFPKMQFTPIQEKLPKRLNFAYFWARTRFVQRACMVCAVLYFSFLVYHQFYPAAASANEPETTREGPSNLSNRTWTMDFNKAETLELHRSELETSPQSKVSTTSKDSVKRKRSANFHSSEEREVGSRSQEKFDQQKTTSQTSESGHTDETLCFSIPNNGEHLRNSSRRYWPQLMNFYNISVFGRFITILPPVQLGVMLETSSFNRIKAPDSTSFIYQAFSRQSKEDREDDGAARTDNDAEYFLGAFYVVVLGIVVMIGLFFVCKFLNDSQIIVPRRRMHHQNAKKYNIMETAPVSLKGHPQTVDCLVREGSIVVSTCLGGQIRVWNSNTGEGMAFSRNRLKSRKRRQQKRKLSIMNSSINTNFEEHAARMRNASQSSGESSQSPVTEKPGFDFNSGLIQSELENVLQEKPLPRSWSNCWNSNSDWKDSDDLSGSEWSPDESLESGNHRVNGVNCSESDEEEVLTPIWCIDLRDSLVLAGCANGGIEAWHILSGKRLFSEVHHGSGVVSLCFLQSREQFAAARLDGTIDFYSLEHFGQAQPQASQHSTTYRSPRRHVISPAQPGARPVENAGLAENDVSGFTGCSYSWLCTVRAHHHLINVMKADLGLLISGSQDRTLKVYRSDDATCVFTLHGHGASVTALSVSKSASLIPEVVSGAADGVVRVWDLRMGVCSVEMRGHQTPVASISCSAKHIISLDLGDTLRLWERCNGHCMYKFKQPSGPCTDIALLSSNFLVSSGQGGVVVWDLNTGRIAREVFLGNNDRSVLIHRVLVCDNATVVCDYGNELRLVAFPGVLAKVE